MRRPINIFIFLSILSVSCFSQKSISKDWILLIDYNEHTSCEVLEIDGREVNPNKHFCGEIPAIIDDFSEFFPIKKVFYYDGKVELTDNDFILFWDYNIKKQVDSLPFIYSNTKIKTFENDTTIKVFLNDTEISLAPNEIQYDTIVIKKKGKNKLVKYTTIVSIENLGLIKKENVIDNKDWKTKSLELKLDAPSTAEIMPEFEGGNNELLKYLTENIEYPKHDSSNIINTKLVIEFIVDEKGEITVTRILRSINPTFDNHVMEVLKNMPRWKPGMNNGKAVPVKMAIPINIELK